MLIDVNESLLILVDAQEKLMPYIHEYEKLIEHCGWLLKAAAFMDVPVMAAEQYPQGLGHTIPELAALLPAQTPVISKNSFSCLSEKKCIDYLKQEPKEQIILMGIEAHVCVLQTALEMLDAGHEVYVVADAVSSRYENDYRHALDRMNGEGVILVTREMVVFEWLRGTVGTDRFRDAQRLLFPKLA